MHNGDPKWLAPRYEGLQKKLLMERVGEDGLVASSKQQMAGSDIVDWPTTERDGYVFTAQNTVVNAFHLKAVSQMAELAAALGKTAQAKAYSLRYQESGKMFQEKFFNKDTGHYRDGSGTEHSSIHANFFPLAFGLVPSEKQPKVIEFLKSRGMACSVYAAQYLMEALFESGADVTALDWITADGDRSWKHMVNSGTTITWEAWDQKYKPNQDWNHAWGAAPANLLPRYVLGVTPTLPGWKAASISPRTGVLEFAQGKVPTPRGPILINWKKADGFTLEIILPAAMPAKVDLPAAANSEEVRVNGKKVEATRKGDRWFLTKPLSGKAKIEVQNSANDLDLGDR